MRIRSFVAATAVVAASLATGTVPAEAAKWRDCGTTQAGGFTAEVHTQHTTCKVGRKVARYALENAYQAPHGWRGNSLDIADEIYTKIGTRKKVHVRGVG